MCLRRFSCISFSYTCRDPRAESSPDYITARWIIGLHFLLSIFSWNKHSVVTVMQPTVFRFDNRVSRARDLYSINYWLFSLAVLIVLWSFGFPSIESLAFDPENGTWFLTAIYIYIFIQGQNVPRSGQLFLTSRSNHAIIFGILFYP